eukprot:15239919-Alexandrium_andersonii.AAC.1
MSASLVGSEMCIRDRPPPTPPPPPRAASWRVVGVELPTSEMNARGTCLLYTSDAADDMQCRS